MHLSTKIFVGLLAAFLVGGFVTFASKNVEVGLIAILATLIFSALLFLKK